MTGFFKYFEKSSGPENTVVSRLCPMRPHPNTNPDLLKLKDKISNVSYQE